jgi:SnoaL-like domain
MTDRLEARLRRLEDVDAIARLKSQYAHYWNFGWEGAGQSGEKLSALFTDDAYIDYGAFGRADGRAAIAEMADGWARGAGTATDGTPLERPGLSVHFLTTPNITVDGDTGTGKWTGTVAATAEGTPMWIAGQYTDQFARQPEGWLIASVTFDYAFATPYAGPGWVDARFPGGS